MTAERLPDLAFEFMDDGTLRLTQDIGLGEADVVDIHPYQLRLLADRAGLLAPQRSSIDNDVAARRLRIIEDKLCEFSSNQHHRKEIVERCGCGIEFWIELDGICDLAIEFTADIDLLRGGLVRDLNRILDGADDLFRFLASVGSFPPQPEEEEDVARARKLVEDIQALIAIHAGGSNENLPGNNGNAPTPATSISVTEANKPKRGRPSTGEAMSNAERQARHRANQRAQASFLDDEGAPNVPAQGG